MKKAKTAKLMSGVIATAVIMTGCGTQQATTQTTTQDNGWSNNNVQTNTTSVAASNSCGKEVELEHLQDRFPGVDLDAMEDYFEDNCINYDEDEFTAYLDDVSDDGQVSSQTNNYSSFPWWLFLLTNNSGYSGIKHGSGITNKSGVVSGTKTPVKTPVTSGKTTVTPITNNAKTPSTSTSKTPTTPTSTAATKTPTTTTTTNSSISKSSSFGSSGSSSSSFSSSPSSSSSSRSSSSTSSGFGSGSSSSGS